MSRTKTRVSRGLIALLVATIILGSVFYFHRPSKTVAVPAGPPNALASATPVAKAPEVPSPATKPTTNPSNPAISAMNTSWNASSAVVTSTPKFGAAMMVKNDLPQMEHARGLATPTTNPTGAVASAPTTKPVTPSAPSASFSTPKEVVLSGDPMTDGEAKLAAGDLLGAREIFNAALSGGKLSADQTRTAKAKLTEINQTVVFSHKQFANDPFGGTYSVKSGDKLQSIAAGFDVPWELLAKLNGLSDPKKLRAGKTLKVIHGPLNAVVSKSAFTLDLYLGSPGEKGSVYVTTYPVGLGKDDSTPTGVWMVEVHNKIKNPTYYSPRGEGVIDSKDEKNPLGTRWLGLTGIDGHAVGKTSYGIHGTIHPESVGKMESMGCIRLKNEDVEQVFDLLTEGKSMVIVKD